MSEEEPKAAPAEGERDIRGILTEKPTQERWDDMKVRDAIGITATIERNQAEGVHVTKANHSLNDLGAFIHDSQPGLQGLKYLGSAAVHIYIAEALGELEFVTQVCTLQSTEERFAGPAFTQLQKDMKTLYGRRNTRVRSGF